MIRATFKPVVYAFSRYLEEADHVLKNGDTLKLGDRMFEVIHTPGHSTDSICLYCEEEGVLFAGDTPLIIRRPGDTYPYEFLKALEKLSQKGIQSIYFGHGQPILNNCNALIRTSLENVRKSVEGKNAADKHG
jgi:glyoxylase-like metal-dependent hydrolase (beta-lactamase superfamily II)